MDSWNGEFWTHRFGSVSKVCLGNLVLALLDESIKFKECHREHADRILYYMLELDDSDEPMHTRQVLHSQFATFLCRFGPVHLAFGKASSSFFSDEGGNLVSWFHGTISRKTAENRVQNLPHGSFLIRFSNQEPNDKFSLTHMKVRTLKHCLIYNVGVNGFSLTQDASESYPSITELVKAHSADRLSKPVLSPISRKFKEMFKDQEADEGIYANPYRLFATTEPSLNQNPPLITPSMLPPTPPLSSPSSNTLTTTTTTETTNMAQTSMSENELARLRLARLEGLDITLSEIFDKARTMSFDKDKQCIAFDEFVNLANTIQSNLNSISNSHQHHNQILANCTSGFDSNLVRNYRGCSLLVLYLRTLIAAADLSTSLVTPLSSDVTAAAGGGVTINEDALSLPAVKLYKQALEVSQFVMENLPFDAFDEGQEDSSASRLSLTRTATMRVDPSFDQCRLLTAHVHLKLALLNVDPYAHFSQMMGNMNGSFSTRLRECVASISNSQSKLDEASALFSIDQANTFLEHGRKLLRDSKEDEAVVAFEQSLQHARLSQLSHIKNEDNITEQSDQLTEQQTHILKIAVIEIKALANIAQAKYKMKAYNSAILNHRCCLLHLGHMSKCPDEVLDVKNFNIRILNAACLACKDSLRYADSMRLCKRQLSLVSTVENINSLNVRLAELESLSNQ